MQKNSTDQRGEAGIFTMASVKAMNVRPGPWADYNKLYNNINEQSSQMNQYHYFANITTIKWRKKTNKWMKKKTNKWMTKKKVLGEQGWHVGSRRWRWWWERLPPTNVSQVQFPNLASYVGWVCSWFSSLLQGFFSGFSGFPPSSKINKFQFDLGFEGHGFVSLRKTVMCYPC